jgi:small subunit ribosomal protein S15
MVLQTAQKKEIITKFKTSDNDTGSPEVQIALLTARIEYLTQHFSAYKKDHHSRRGLIRAVNQRRKLLDYLKRKNVNKYKEILKELNLRK